MRHNCKRRGLSHVRRNFIAAASRVFIDIIYNRGAFYIRQIKKDVFLIAGRRLFFIILIYRFT